ncbi:MAG: preprotein translocase subunit SecY, partial [Nitrososphaerales archaeon]|nr:preprotein translocase subunit SecY [Nitrososphaerales archaeon]
IALVESSAYIIGGLFGVAISPTVGFIITMQLIAGTIMVMLLDEMVQKGWGIGSGISLFILAGVTQRIMWDIFSPLPAGGEPYGLVPFLINATIHNQLHTTIFRTGQLPSLSTFALTLLVIFIIIYIEGMRIEIPITSIRFRGFSGIYPIKLLYTSNVPIILVSALLTNIIFFSQQIWARFNPLNNDPLLNLLVMYDRANVEAGPIGGLVYFITPVHGLDRAAAEPLRALTYTLFIGFFSVLFAKLWVDISGLSPKAAAKSLVDAKVQVPGFRRVEASVEAMLSRYIPTITIISGTIIGLIAATSEILGVFGTGIGILLMIGIIIQYYQLLLREHLERMMPRLGSLLGMK